MEPENLMKRIKLFEITTKESVGERECAAQQQRSVRTDFLPPSKAEAAGCHMSHLFGRVSFLTSFKKSPPDVARA